MDTELFNEKTIKRLCSNVNVSQKQKKNANDWVKLLESGSLGKERTNYFRFAIYILRDILGYSIREDLDYEKANIEFTFKDSIGKTVLCIEAKGDTQDLFSKQGRTKKEQSTPFKQTWDNMGRIDTIKYGICTNYRDFILIDKSKGYSKYHFFDFLSIKDDPEKLKEFIAIFSKESIIDKEFIEKLYEKSIIEEREFTKEFYKLFHETRLMLIKEFQDNGATKDESIHYTQIFLNRLMFVFFAQDTGKLRKRLFEEKVLNILKADSIFSENTKLVCTLIKSIFQNLNEGSKRHNIFGFNGGLFKEIIPDGVFFKDFRKKTFFDEIYQNSKIKKDIELDEKSKAILSIYNGNINPIILNLLYLASFDFNTEVSVNILGHIFEQSISDLEEIKEEKVLRRKKEGVYYTPDFITDYICRNTIIPYLSKKESKTVDKLVEEYFNNIQELENKLRTLKILDPACGSGSFLLKAVEVLLEIHKEIQIVKEEVGDYTAKKKSSMKRWQKRGIKGDSQLTLIKWNEEDEAREIIENNIYGVDINEESVEITKLSLFFKIVKKNKKLIDLSGNIKCGNSLISDPIVANEREFKWESEFPFKFDIIIGNPPYVRQERLGSFKEYFEKNYEVYNFASDLFAYFYEKSALLLKKDGLMCFISNTFTKTTASYELRSYLTKNLQFVTLADFSDLQIFEGATTYPIIPLIKNNYSQNNKFKYFKVRKENLHNLMLIQKNLIIKINQDKLDNKNWTFESDEERVLKEKIKNNPTIKEEFGKCYYGLKTALNEAFIVSSTKKKKMVTFRGVLTGLNEAFIVSSTIKNNIRNKNPETKKFFKPYLEGKDLNKWAIVDADKWLILFPKGWTKDKLGEDITESSGWEHIKQQYPLIAAHLEPFMEKAKKRYDKGEFWWELRACSYYDFFEKEKIVWPNLQSTNKFSFDNERYYINAPAVILPTNDKSLLCILNSKLAWYFFKDICVIRSGGFIEIKPQYFEQFPYKKPKNESEFIKLGNLMIDLNKKFHSTKIRFINRMINNLSLQKITKKIENFIELSFDDLLKELSKQKIKLSLKQQDEWEDYFNEYKKELISLQKQIIQTEGEINKLVYGVYSLTKAEINIIENSI